MTHPCPSPKNKTLILIRHAHRDTRFRQKDNGLSEKGQKQALALSKTLRESLNLENADFISSPKKRCIETLLPCAKKVARSVVSDPLLDEKKSEESEESFRKRIRNFLNRWHDGNSSITVLCSHGDWLPIAFQFLVGTPAEFEKSSWAEIELIEGKPVLNFRN